jgi:ribonucleoside-diphosphate reductase alpha chain
MQNNMFERPDILNSTTFKLDIGYGNNVHKTYITIGLENNKPMEVFVYRDDTVEVRDLIEGLCRMLSISLQGGVPLEEICKQLRGIHGSARTTAVINNKQIFMESLPDAIAQILSQYKGN